VTSLNAQRDLDSGSSLFRQATQLKKKNPGLKVLLGVGGGVQDNNDKWLELLEQSTSRISFINSAYDLIRTYDFDGLDLSFEFPKIKIKKVRSGIGEFLKKFEGFH
jgi:GH18 family chitinase